MNITGTGMDVAALAREMNENGCAVARQLFSPEEVEEIKTIFSEIHDQGVPGFYEPEVVVDPSLVDILGPEDMLKKWPRVVHPHRFNARAKHYMLHAKVSTLLESFFGEEPVATQSMYYFKPPGSRGQALHQDNYYLMVRPGTCIAAWTAIDDCDEENGGMMVVPGSHRIDLACPGSANPKVSFTKDYVPVPKGLKAQMMRMKAGDTLFFNGTVIHGSGPNRSKNRFRRSFICHYAGGSTEHISRYFNPMITMAGEEISIKEPSGGGPCGGEWASATSH